MEPEMEEWICAGCNGSGEGRYGPPGESKCRDCGGSGVVYVEAEPEWDDE